MSTTSDGAAILGRLDSSSPFLSQPKPLQEPLALPSQQIPWQCHNNLHTTISTPQCVKFVPFSSAIESPFLVRYNQLNLETIQLSEEPIRIQATYGVVGEQHPLGQEQQLHPLRLQCQESRIFPGGI